MHYDLQCETMRFERRVVGMGGESPQPPADPTPPEQEPGDAPPAPVEDPPNG